MAIPDDILKLFKIEGRFKQIAFLDRFFENVNIANHSSKELERFLFPLLECPDRYIRRSVLIIICDLHTIGKIHNTYGVLSEIYKLFDTETDVFVLSAALNYFPLIAEHFSEKDKSWMVLFTENENGDISSEAYFALALIQLSSVSQKSNKEELIATLIEAKKLFKESSLVSENRTDAEFAESLLSFLQFFIDNNRDQADYHLQRAKEIFLIRQVYEFNQIYAELDYVIFSIFDKLSFSLKILGTSNEWINFSFELRQLIRINKQIDKLKKKDEKGSLYIEKYYDSILKKSLDILYNNTLEPDRKRIQRINEEGEDTELINFTNHLLSILPIDKSEKDNIGLLTRIIEYYGAEEAETIYKKAKENPEEIVKVLGSMPQRNSSGLSQYPTGSLTGNEVYQSFKSQLSKYLPQYPEDKLSTFLDILEEVIRYTRMTMVESSKSDFLFLYSKKEGGLGAEAKEVDLQNHMFQQLKMSNLAYGFEHEKAKFVDGGRVDIVFKIDSMTIPIELKKTTSIVNIESIEANYIAQAQTYASGYDQLGIFILLDLTDKAFVPNSNFKDLFNIHHLKPSTDLPIRYPDYIISIVIPGNKTLPSSKSVYK